MHVSMYTYMYMYIYICNVYIAKYFVAPSDYPANYSGGDLMIRTREGVEHNIHLIPGDYCMFLTDLPHMVYEHNASAHLVCM
jgi:hypothetical protein